MGPCASGLPAWKGEERAFLGRGKVSKGHRIPGFVDQARDPGRAGLQTRSELLGLPVGIPGGLL